MDKWDELKEWLEREIAWRRESNNIIAETEAEIVRDKMAELEWHGGR